MNTKNMNSFSNNKALKNIFRNNLTRKTTFLYEKGHIVFLPLNIRLKDIGCENISVLTNNILCLSKKYPIKCLYCLNNPPLATKIHSQDQNKEAI